MSCLIKEKINKSCQPDLCQVEKWMGSWDLCYGTTETFHKPISCFSPVTHHIHIKKPINLNISRPIRVCMCVLVRWLRYNSDLIVWRNNI